MEYFLKLYFLKILKKTKLLCRFNFRLCKTYNNFKIQIPFSNGIGLTNFVVQRNFLDQLIEGFVTCQNGVFVDVGVNIGQSLIKLKSLNPNIEYYGFEPNAACVAYVQTLINNNGFNACNVIHCALSNKIQVLDLHKSLIDDSRASVVESIRPNYFTGFEKVIAIDYNSFYSKLNITFLKIDVEGAELEVLDGMLGPINKHRPIITCEILDSHNKQTHAFAMRRAVKLKKLLDDVAYGVIQLHTDDCSIVSYNHIDEIQIRQWSSSSKYHNDYLFFPNEKEMLVDNTLNMLLSQGNV